MIGIKAISFAGVGKLKGINYKILYFKETKKHLAFYF